MDIFDLETKYLIAKEKYYTGEDSGMSDDEFDALEALLKEMESDVVNLVGVADRNYKHSHLSPMNSLDKIQAHLDNTLPWDQIDKWFSKFPKNTIFEAGPKFDGMAINLIYRSGNIERGITRGDKTKGKDATAKLMRKIPLRIESENDIEVRGEAVIPYKIFEEKYRNHDDPNIRKFKNPRNFVAGVINRDELSEDLMNEIRFMAVEARIHDGDYTYPENTNEFFKKHGFNKTDYFTKKFYYSRAIFQQVYDIMQSYRENDCPFQLDGFVVKAQENVRLTFGETGHHPEWAVAIKFPPKKAITKTIGFKNRVGITGEIIPGIMLKGVELDGTTVSNTAGFNWGYILENGLFPGATVSIAKSGDIIPIITNVIDPVYNGEIPKICPCGKGGTRLEGIHLYCTNEVCPTKMKKRFIVGVGIYKMPNFGGVTRTNLFECGINEIGKVFDRRWFNKENLIFSGYFKEGKTLDKLLKAVDDIKTVTLPQVILSLGFEGIGSTAARELAKYIRGKKYSFSNLEREPLNGFDLGQEKRIKVDQLIKTFEDRGVEIIEEIVLEGGIGIEFTGSPKASGLNTKGELEKFLLGYGYNHQGLKTAKFLLTDSLNSPSSKMSEANKRNVKIYEYTDFINKLKNGETV